MTKRYNNLYHNITKLENIMDIYDNVIRKNTKNKRKIQIFENNYCSNIIDIKNKLTKKCYIPGKYNIFFIREPKLRIIMSQDIDDKIVNHLVAKYILINVFDKTLIDNNCATRINKGTHYALNVFKKYINDCNRKYNEFYILKFDISKYFYNIDHNIVKDVIRRKIKDKDALDIVFKIIDTTNCDYVNDEIIRLKQEEIAKLDRLDSNYENKIKEIEDIPLYNYDKGFPIGNMTSQIIATFYLNELDHYIKENLNIKYYIRYMDDGIIIHNNKKYLNECIRLINLKLNEFGLSLNKKTKVYKNNESLEFLGFNFYYDRKLVMRVKRTTKYRFIKRYSKVYNKYINGIIYYDEYLSIRNSYIGHLKYGDCDCLLYKYIRDYS